MADQIENATKRFVTVTAFNGTLTSIDSTQATASIGFVAIPSQLGTDFVTVLDNILAPFGGSGLDSIFRSALTLQTGETVNVNYNGSTYLLTLQATTTYVSDLDAQVNKLKTQYLQPLLARVSCRDCPCFAGLPKRDLDRHQPDVNHEQPRS